MNERILCVDDDPNILAAYQRQMHKHYAVDTALGGKAALEKLTPKSAFAAIVSDLRMPEMDGVEFLARARRQAPDSVRVMLTGNADLDQAIQAVNEGNIFRFLTKPCPPGLLLKTMDACVKQYRLVVAERELIEKTLKGCMKILTEVMSLVSPLAFGRASRSRRLSARIAKTLGVEQAWQVEVAAMLSQVGCVAIPNDVLRKLDKGQCLEPREKHMYSEHPSIGANLISMIPRLEDVAEIVKYQNKHYNGKGLPNDGVREKAIPIGARILHVVLDYDRHLTVLKDSRTAFQELTGCIDFYDRTVLQILGDVIHSEVQAAPISVGLKDLMPGMVLAEDVKSARDVVLISQGQEVTPSLKMRLENFASGVKIQEPIHVIRPKYNDADS